METEAKFTVPDEATFERLKQTERFGSYERRDTRQVEVHDRFVDTPDRRFYADHYYARLRESKGNLLMTLKSLGNGVKGAVHTREEYQVAVPGLDLESWPEGEVRDRVTQIAGGQPLEDLVSLDQNRTVSILYDGERAIAELGLDVVEIKGADAPVRVYELEAELLPEGTRRDLKVLGRILTGEYALTPQPLSKFERALELAQTTHPAPETGGREPTPIEHGRRKRASRKGETVAANAAEPALAEAPAATLAGEEAPVAPEAPAERAPQAPEEAPEPPKKKTPAGIMPDDSMELAVRKMLRVQLDALRSVEDGARSGEDIEALHDMRVATRRMRAGLRIAGPYLAGRAPGRALDGLRELTRALGRVRDLDVLIDNAQGYLVGLPEGQRSGLDPLLHEWESRRDKARKRLVKLLDSREYGRFEDRLTAWLDEPESPRDLTGPVEPYRVRHVAGSALWQRYETVRAYETIMDAPLLAQLHALRIDAKYLRYTLEFFSEVLPQETQALVADLVEVQDHLGALHDAGVAAGLIREQVATITDEQDKGDGEGVEQAQALDGLLAYLAEREQSVRDLMEGFAGPWEKIASPEWRGRFATTVAEL